MESVSFFTLLFNTGQNNVRTAYITQAFELISRLVCRSDLIEQ